MKPVLRELRILVRPATAIIALGLLTMSFLTVGLNQAKANAQWHFYTQSQQLAAQRVEQCKAQSPSAEVCRALERRSAEAQHDLARQVSAAYPLAQAARTPPGALGVAAGLMASLPGLLAIAALASVHVGSEWTFGTVRPLLGRHYGRLSFLWAKCISTILAAFALLLLLWIALIAVGPVLQVLYQVPPEPASPLTSQHVAVFTARAILVLGVFGTLCTCLTVIVRSVMGAFALLMAGLFGSVVLAGFTPILSLSPAYWLAGWMHYRPETSMADHVWVDRFPLLNPDPALTPTIQVGLTGLGVALVAAVLVGSVRMHRSDIGG